MLCPKCNSENRSEARFCDQCGFPIADLADEPKQAPPDDAVAPDWCEGDLEDAGEAYDDVSIETDYELYQPVDSENTDSLDPAAAIDRLIFPDEMPPEIERSHAIDLSGFDTQSEEYAERLVDSGYVPPEQTFRDGGTIQMKRVDGEEPQKSKDYLASSTTKKKHRGRIIAIVVALVAVAAAIAVFATYEAAMWGGKPIPDVVGMTEADAKSVLEDSGFTVRVDKVKSDDTAGIVLLMDPAAGQRCNEGDEVVINVAAARTIPDVVGKTKEEAQELLSEEGFENVKTKEKSSEKKKGTVIEVSPKAGTEALSSAEVTITIAKPYTVPDVSNKSFDDAVKALKDAGLGYDVEYIDTESYPEGTIIGTDPPAGTAVNKGDYIMIEIAQDHGSVLEELAQEVLAPGTTLEQGDTSYTVESLDSVTYIGNDTVSYTATCRPFTTFFGEVFSSSTTQSISGTIVFDENNQVVAIS